jgi:hypothetical protein
MSHSHLSALALLLATQQIATKQSVQQLQAAFIGRPSYKPAHQQPIK